ncbi:nucleoside-diphosphate-sugar epimerase protein [Apiospora marii]|uniref:Nucleoside-diphosphate-sugar epimerase protein n=1 Tax=Apiospora marii TaxID=335849 RepID=A0ABR1SH98_9PEZI
MHLILTGATGLIGSAVLDAMIKMKEVTKISILSRRRVAMAEAANDQRINVIINEDFEKYDAAVLSQLEGAQGCVWALGTHQYGVGRESAPPSPEEPSQDQPPSPEESSQDLPPSPVEPFRFIYVSGLGAETGTSNEYLDHIWCVKGRAEYALATMRKKDAKRFHALSVRPGLVDGRAHEAIQSYIPTAPLMEDMLSSGMMSLRPSILSPTEPLGTFLTKLAMGRYDEVLQVAGNGVQQIGGFPILDNSAFRRMAMLDSI